MMLKTRVFLIKQRVGEKNINHVGRAASQGQSQRPRFTGLWSPFVHLAWLGGSSLSWPAKLHGHDPPANTALHTWRRGSLHPWPSLICLGPGTGIEP